MTAEAPTPSLLRCQRALASSRDGYWEHHLHTGGVWYSTSFLRLFGFAPDAPMPSMAQAHQRLHPDDCSRILDAYRSAVASCGDFDYEVRYLDAHNLWRWVRGRGQVWPDADGRPEVISGAVTDVHQEKLAQLSLAAQQQALEALVHERTARLEAALALAEERRQEAERAAAAKSRFLAHMSHEIRTPLNGVLGLTELALRSADTPELQRFLSAAHQSGQALLQTISDVLDLSRIESGHAGLRRKPFDATQALADTLRAVMPLARQRDLMLLFDWVGDSHWLQGDPGSLRQIVTNLLGNAVKFTPQGSVSLRGETRRGADGRVALEVQVIDTGPGIAPERRAQVFEPFVQGDDSLSRGHGGAGLGLAIATLLAEAMEGQLTLDCPDGGGSVFTLRLLLDEAEAPAQAPEPPAPPPGLAWLVYHREDAGQWLAQRLQRLGWQTRVLDSVAEASRLAQQAEAPGPDLVLLAEPALQPGIDLRVLRELLPQAQLRLLVRPDWRDTALESAASALQIRPLVAPLTPRQLRHILTNADDGLGGDTTDAHHAAPALQADATVLLVEDNEVNQLVGQELLHALGLHTTLAGNGASALTACLERPPSLVLMDLQLPGMDGLETTRRLRAMQRDRRWPGAPIVALTAHASPEDHAACRAAGMDGVLTKPLQLDTLRRRLARWLAA
ncbi:PAS domain-containing hybrid sensor histidine kinase/response regulator [Aquabacterium sp. OR-4]|uniref:PAS domain-containing hybrid sensor histidine kinase/response regulator n=1 Tax=Aquabacterium sp. OR-4 TaxID=2978127 RepID=UPI0021B2E165|nr:PAS domain-containing hybrid sensor histidine kinase/response regulator [Aquabacterium sp. OR-4]MDT7837359.1 ATP-binding protein [Aquabacterium sp. OR-4]